MVYLMKTITTDRWVPRLERFPDGRSGQSYAVAEFLAGTVDPKFDRPDYSATIDLHWGQRVPDELVWRVPKALYHFGPRRWKAMPDIIGNIINQKVFDIVERLDPGIHQFFPVEIIYEKSGKPYTEGGPFRFWNILRSAIMPELFDVEALRGNGEITYSEKIEDQTLLGGEARRTHIFNRQQGHILESDHHINNERVVKFIKVYLQPGDPNLIIRRSAFQRANALWTINGKMADGTFCINNSNIYITDTLHAAFKAAKVNAVEYAQTRETD